MLCEAILVSQVLFPPHPIPYPTLVYLASSWLPPHLPVNTSPSPRHRQPTHPPTYGFPPEDTTLLKHILLRYSRLWAPGLTLQITRFRLTRSLHSFPPLTKDTHQRIYGSAHYSTAANPSPLLPVCALPRSHITSIVTLHWFGTGREPPLEGTDAIGSRWAG